MTARTISVIYQMLESDYKKKQEAFLDAKPSLGQSQKDWDNILNDLRQNASDALDVLEDFDKNLFGGSNG